MWSRQALATYVSAPAYLLSARPYVSQRQSLPFARNTRWISVCPHFGHGISHGFNSAIAHLLPILGHEAAPHFAERRADIQQRDHAAAQHSAADQRGHDPTQPLTQLHFGVSCCSSNAASGQVSASQPLQARHLKTVVRLLLSG